MQKMRKPHAQQKSRNNFVVKCTGKHDYRLCGIKKEDGSKPNALCVNVLQTLSSIAGHLTKRFFYSAWMKEILGRNPLAQPLEADNTEHSTRINPTRTQPGTFHIHTSNISTVIEW